MCRKRMASVAEKAGRLQNVFRHHGLEDIELVVALGSPHGHRHVVAHDLRTNHGHGLALRWIDLAGHDARARLVRGQQQLPDARARA